MASERLSRGLQTANFTVAINLSLAALKGLVGVATGSAGLIADAGNSLADLVTSAGAIIGLRVGEAPPDEDHPYGHRRIESEVTRLLALLVAAGGLAIGWSSLRRLTSPALAAPGMWAAAVALFSIVVKEWASRHLLRVSSQISSPVLEAAAWDYRSDVLLSLVVLAGVVGSQLGAPWLDPLAGIAVSAVIVGVGVRLYLTATRQMVDEAPDAETLAKIRRAVEQTAGVVRLHDLKARFAATEIHVDLTIAVDGDLTVEEGHRIAERSREAVMRSDSRVREVLVHVDPAGVESPS